MNHDKLQPGFTLVELLIALFIFSLMSVFAFRAVTVLGNGQESLALEQSEIGDIQKALSFWERDLRDSKANVSQSEQIGSGFEGGGGLVVSFLMGRKGNAELHDEQEAGIETITYRLENGSIYREKMGGVTEKVLLISNIESASANLIEGVVVDGVEQKVISGIQLTMVHQAFGEIERRVFLGLGEADKDLTALILEGEGGTSAGGAPTTQGDGGNNSGEANDRPPPPDPLGGVAIW